MKIEVTYIAPSGPGAAEAAPEAAEPASPEPAATEPTAEVSTPDNADIASRFEVSWSGPGGGEDFIAVAPARATRQGERDPHERAGGESAESLGAERSRPI